MLPESRFPKLISLLDKGQRVQPDILGAAIRVEFENIAKARQLGISWNEIAEALGFPGKGKLASASYSRERQRRAKKEKEVTPEKKKWTTAPKEKNQESPGLDGPAAEKGTRPRLLTKQPGGGTDFFENLPEA